MFKSPQHTGHVTSDLLTRDHIVMLHDKTISLVTPFCTISLLGAARHVSASALFAASDPHGAAAASLAWRSGALMAVRGVEAVILQTPNRLQHIYTRVL